MFRVHFGRGHLPFSEIPLAPEIYNIVKYCALNIDQAFVKENNCNSSNFAFCPCVTVTQVLFTHNMAC